MQFDNSHPYPTLQDGVTDLQSVIAKLSELRYLMQTDKPLPLLLSGNNLQLWQEVPYTDYQYICTVVLTVLFRVVIPSCAVCTVPLLHQHSESNCIVHTNTPFVAVCF